MYTTVSKKQHSRDGSICAFDHHSELKFGSIIQFCFCNNDLIAVVDTFEYLNASILDHIRPSTNNELTLSACSSISEFVYCVKKLSSRNNTFAIPVSSLFVKCVHVPIQGAHYDFIVTIPNMYEHH